MRLCMVNGFDRDARTWIPSLMRSSNIDMQTVKHEHGCHRWYAVGERIVAFEPRTPANSIRNPNAAQKITFDLRFIGILSSWPRILLNHRADECPFLFAILVCVDTHSLINTIAGHTESPILFMMLPPAMWLMIANPTHGRYGAHPPALIIQDRNARADATPDRAPARRMIDLTLVPFDLASSI